jgi:para-aminobenzoate synthetase component 1
MKRGNTLSTSPIKGTISKNVKNYEAILLESQKESAELSMIVDLLRNDISRASDISPSKVIKHREIMDLGNLVHTYSTIESETSLNLCEILWETLPGGSISGCPKREAVLNILKLEPYARGPYTGICGWWHKDNFELNILIRSLVLLPNGKCFYSAGGGIVYDSKCNMEYDEILLKAEMIREKTDD